MKYLQRKLVLLVALWGSGLFGSSRLNFSSRASAINLQSGAKFTVGSPINNFRGVLIKDSNATIVGSSITFANGSFEENNNKIVLNGSLNPTTNQITLSGNKSMRVEQGRVLNGIFISGDNNRLEGQTVFTNSIAFDSNATLTISIQNALNQNIQFDSGGTNTLRLESDISLCDDVTIVNNGTIDVNGRKFSFGGKQLSLSNNIFWRNAGDITLWNKVDLSGTWYFDSESTLNGNGNVIDVSTGGVFDIASSTTLHIADVTILGLTDNTFVFGDVGSTVRLSNVTIQVNEDVSTAKGMFYVDGPSTIILHNNDFTFGTDSKLTISAVTLWLDGAGKSSIGNVLFGDVENYSLINSGTVKDKGSGNGCYLADWVEATSDTVVSLDSRIASLQNRLDLVEVDDGDTHLVPGESLSFNTNQTFDGNGKGVVFSSWDQPQFIVADGVTVTLKNINLMRINSNTFQMGTNSKIRIDRSVLFELNQDLDWQNGTIEMIGTSDVFIVRGLGKAKKLNFGSGNCSGELVLSLGSNTLLLQNIELDGLCFIDGTSRLRDRYLQVGSITLGGNVVVNVCANTRMSFVAAGHNNQLCLRENNILFSGSLLFGDLFSNELHIKFLLDDDQKGLIPRVYFGSDFVYITAQSGLAKIIFDDSYVQVFNQTSDSFVVSKYSYLSGYNLEILNNPIKQISNDFTLAPGLVLNSDCQNAIEQASFKSPFLILRSGPELTTAFHKSGIKLDEYSQDELDPVFKAWTTDNDLEITLNSIKISDAKNSIRLDGGKITKFGISGSEPLKLTMVNGSTIEQGDQDVELKSGDEIIIKGVDNKILVTKTFVIKGKLSFDQLSKLTFEFEKTNEVTPEIYFDSEVENVLEITKGTVLQFKGHGKVVFKDGYTIQFNGEISNMTSELRLKDSAELLLEENSICYVTGFGKFSIEDRSKVHIESGRQLIFGTSETDYFEIVIDRDGQILVDSVRDEQNKGKISFQLAEYKINVKRNGKLSVGTGGLLEINSLNQQESRGYLSNFIFDSAGVLKIDRSGFFVIGRNKGTPELPIAFDCVEGSVQTGGFLGFVGNGFLGEIQDISSFCCSSGLVEIGADAFVELCINTMPSLAVTTLFIDFDGNQKLRTKNGVIVELLSGDRVLEDNSITGQVSVLNDGEVFVIRPDGQRI